jgi:hypothetical protein
MKAEEEVDPEDLSLLDDPYVHAGCGKCYPIDTMRHYDKYVGICGKEAILQPTEPGGSEATPPSNACPDCLEICRTTRKCSVCGHIG